MVRLCGDLGIIPVAYTPLGLISEARPEFIGKDTIKTDPGLGELAEKYDKTRAQIALRYLVSITIYCNPKSLDRSKFMLFMAIGYDSIQRVCFFGHNLRYY